MKDGTHKGGANGNLTLLIKDKKCIGCFAPEETKALEEAISKNRDPAFVEPSSCSVDELREIIETDFFCSLEYHKELEKKLKRKSEVEYWEEKTQIS